MPRRINGGSRGQIMPLMVFAIVPVLIFAALALDVGYWRNEQRKQQTAVDSAAIAAAVEAAVSSTASPLPSVTAARTDATSNGYTHDGINTILTVNDPPTTGNYTADATAVEVYLKVKHGGLFTGIVGQRSDWITTRAVARLTTTNSNCFVILSTADDATNFSADAVTLPACGILDDGGWSDHDTETVTATYVGVAGKLNAPSGTYPNARPTPSTIPAVDRCPTIAGCAYLTNNVPATSPCGNNNYSLSSGSATISPGVYCGGIKGHNATLTMHPGLDVLTGANG
ncbi:MAG: Tad domain-containing protein, partial [Candidatus Eremiobacteraeota bacterium]|nr:Tad domain-containing protein [Candidatus Eremiobacteraeota bacterium]